MIICSINILCRQVLIIFKTTSNENHLTIICLNKLFFGEKVSTSLIANIKNIN